MTWEGTPSATSNGGAANALRANRFLATSDGFISGAAAYLNAPAGTPLTVAVWSSTSTTGPFLMDASTTTTVAAANAGSATWHPVDGLGVSVEAGRTYVVGYQWTGSATFHRAFGVSDPAWGDWLGGIQRSGQTSAPTSLSVGTFIGGYGFGLRIVTDDEGDADNDGSLACTDCDDNAATNTPGAAEACDGLDNDCSGSADASGGEGDGDGDGSLGCADCDDADATVYPGNAEVCDGIDNDCDATTVFGGEDTDADGDASIACLDCDDGSAARFPGNPEICDGLDNDCDATTAFAGENTDIDGDGSPTCADCDDIDSSNFPGNPEVCDGLENDCDLSTVFAGEFTDADGDGAVACVDCDETDPAINPSVVELCNGVDDDCDGTADNGTFPVTVAGPGPIPIQNNATANTTVTITDTGAVTDVNLELTITHGWLPDLDIYLIGPDGTAVELATDLYGYAYSGTIFDDEAATGIAQAPRNHSGTFRPEGTLADLDGTDTFGTWTLQVTDDYSNAVGGQLVSWTLYVEFTNSTVDNDGDGAASCADCDDTDPSLNPSVPELCDGLDCDPATDLSGPEIDGDSDGFLGCAECDDSEASTYPGAPESCDGVDSDCSGVNTASLPYVFGDTEPVGSFRGTLIEADLDTTLIEYRQRVNLSVGDVAWVGVYRLDTVGGTPRLLHAVPSTATISGPQWITTAEINIPIEQGEGYAGLAWLEDGGRFHMSTGSGGGEDLGFATVTGALDGDAASLPQAVLEPQGYGSMMQSQWTWGGEDDADGDGVRQCDGDCDDSDPGVTPSVEVCDGVDNDCRRDADSSLLVVDRTLDFYFNSNSATQTYSSIYVAEDVLIGDVNVRVDGLFQASGARQLRIQHPSGAEVVLDSGPYGLTLLYDDALYDDEGRESNTGNTKVGRVPPFGALSDFNGLTSQGEWRLYFVDSGGPSSIFADLDGWGLEITSPDGGDSSACTARTCEEILGADPTAPDAIYWLERYTDGEPYQTFCDMTNDGGGWTLVANVDDDNDPYFGGHTGSFFGNQWINAWESTSLRNETSVATYSSGVSVSTKYASYAELAVYDVRIAYMIGGKEFVCEDLDTQGIDTLPEIFSETPN